MTSMRFLPVLVLLTACSSGAPTVYGQMAPGSPPPIRTLNPAWDAPVTRDAPHATGMPGYIGPPQNIPRGESTRVLPPKREKGFWASRSPHATASVLPEIKLFKILMPIPEDIVESSDLAAMRGCKQLIEGFAATDERRPMARINKLEPNEKTCLSLSLMAKCLERQVKKNAEGLSNSSGHSEEEWEFLLRLMDMTTAMRDHVAIAAKAACDERAKSPSVDELLELFYPQTVGDD